AAAVAIGPATSLDAGLRQMNVGNVFIVPAVAARTLTVRRVDTAGIAAAGAIIETDADTAVHYIAGFADAGDTPFTSDTRIRWVIRRVDPSSPTAAATDAGDFAAVSGECMMPAGA
ncbi:MAG: hypothetical protein OXU22_04290, partial [Gammaproteobacteria bacterium]|nr:hypothetical protein [Gammaproteobacteria bacterium]